MKTEVLEPEICVGLDEKAQGAAPRRASGKKRSAVSAPALKRWSVGATLPIPGLMKTEVLEPEILVAHDARPRRSAKRSVGGEDRGSVSVSALKQWAADAKLPMPWQFASTTVETLLAGKTSAPITVIDFPKTSQNDVYELATSLAKRQQKQPELGYVFFLHSLLYLDAAYQLKLLQLFPDPSKVAITTNLNQTWWALEKFALLWQVWQTRAQPSRKSPLDDMEKVVRATEDLRDDNGKLSAKSVAGLFGFSMRELAGILGRTPQAVNQTPSAESLQDALKYFERVARLRLVLKDDDKFRKWLRMPNPSLGDVTPESFFRDNKWQALADFVDDILTGAPG